MAGTLRIIGDEIHMDGMVVAILVQYGVPATLMATLVYGLDGAVVGDIPDDTGVPDVVGTRGVLHDVDQRGENDRELLLEAFKREGKHGLLRVKDASDIVNRLYDGELN